LSPALLGHGADAGDPIGTFDAEVDRLAEMIEAHGFAGAHLAGYSLGARVGLGLLVRHGAMVSRATLVGVNPGLEAAADRTSRQSSDQTWIAILERDGIERFVDAWESQPLFARPGETANPRTRAIRLRHDPRALARSLRVLGLGAMPNYWPALAALPMPVHLIAGAEDGKFCAIAERMRPLLARGALTLVPGCGHNLLVERPTAVAQALVR
jgi:2-succinyl-6-hydroxy-2,4-cyclohexadiene-1-carboxylate synthase